MSDDLELRLRKLEAAEAARGLRAEYAYACDEGFDGRRIASLFVEDGVIDYGTAGAGRHVGRDAIAAYFDPVPDYLSWCVHMLGSSRIVVEDDAQEATGSWYFLEPCTMRGEAAWVIGAYEDRYRVDSDGRWRFAEVVLKSSVSAPYQTGWTVP